jgi:hypothetical protein
VKQADFHEFKKTGHLALEVRWLKASDPRVCLSIDENLQQTPKSPKGNKGVCLQSEAPKGAFFYFPGTAIMFTIEIIIGIKKMMIAIHIHLFVDLSNKEPSS